jgi:drug/metabolite transporter (DMT)-like permease
MDRAVRTQGQNPRGKSRQRLRVSGGRILSLTAFLLVILAALAHSTWNFLAKRGAHSEHLIWFSSAMEALFFAPIAIWILIDSWSSLGLRAVLFLMATGALHLLYTETLFRGYRTGDLTVVYPLARGTGPLLSFCGAVAWLHERPSLLAASGALLITFGILHCSGGLAAFRDTRNHAGSRRFSFRPSWWSTPATCFGRWFCLSGLIVAVLRCGRNLPGIGRKH